MIDSLLYAKLPLKLKRSVNETYEKIVAHLERELELNALDESGDLPMAPMASASTGNHNLLSIGIDTNMDAQCSYCEATGHFYKSCHKLKKRKEMEEKNVKKPQRSTYPPCDTCRKKNHPTERCWQGAGAHLRPKKTQSEEKVNNATNTETSTSSQTTSKNLTQKTNFATAPNTCLYVGPTIRHIRPCNNKV